MSGGRSGALGALAVALGLSGCVFTPVPEPPPGGPLDLDEVTGTVSLDAGLYRVRLVGGPGAVALPDATLWAVNLDSVEPPVLGDVAEDGSFDFHVDGREGNELRLQVRQEALRTDPVDVLVRDGRSPERIHRPTCLSVDPFYEVDLGQVPLDGSSARDLRLHNGCDDEVVVDSARERVDSPALAIEASPPIAIPVGEASTIGIRLEPDDVGFVEGVLLIDLSGPFAERWPVAWHGEGT